MRISLCLPVALLAILLFADPSLAISPKSAADAVAQGDRLCERKGYTAAIAAYTTAIAIDPKCEKAYCGRGRAYGYQDKFANAIADLEEAVRLDPKDSDALAMRGAAYGRVGDLDRAILDSTGAIRLDPKSGYAHSVRGAVYARKSQFDKAVQDFSEAIRLAPDDLAAYSNRAGIRGNKGDCQGAIADCTEAIRLDSKNSIRYVNRARVYSTANETDKAIADLSHAIQLDPTNVRTYGCRGYVYFQKGDFDKAIADYTEMSRRDPKLAQAYFDRAAAYIAKNELKKALADLNAAIELEPKSPWWHEVRAALRIRLGNDKGGVADLQAMMRLDPKDPAATLDEAPTPTVSAKALEHGRRQVEQMLKDRPAMGKYGKKAELLYDWAARQFAGEKLHSEIIWDGSEPSSADADNHPPEGDSSGRIRIRRCYLHGPEKGKEQGFDDLWACAVFELYNITNAKIFQKIAADVADGNLSSEEFASRSLEAESSAAEKSRAFYIRVFLPWASERNIPTNPEPWYLARSGGGPIRLQSLYTRTDGYWQYYETWGIGARLLRLVENGDYDHAIEFAGQILAQDTTPLNKANAYSFRGYLFLRTNKIDKAIVDLTEAIRLNPADYKARLNRGGAFAQTSDWDGAIADYARALPLAPEIEQQIKPYLADAYRQRAIIRAAKHDWDGTIADLTEAKRLWPQASSVPEYHVDPSLVPSTAAAATKGQPYPTSSTQAGNATTPVDSGQSASAGKTPSAANGYAPPVNLPTATTYFAPPTSGQTAQHYPTPQEQMTTQLIDAYAHRSDNYAARGNWKRAVAEISALMRLAPDEPSWLVKRGTLYERAIDHKKAIADFTEAIRRSDNGSDVYLLRGKSYRNDGDFKAAIADFTEAIRRNRYAPGAAYCERAETFLKKGDLNAAMTDIDAALRFDPNDAEAYRCRASIDERKGDKVKAEQDLAEAKRIEGMRKP